MNTECFIIVLVVLLVVFYIFSRRENFNTDNKSLDYKSNQGLYNYFYQSYMNPYPQSLTKFFSNDKEGEVNLSELNL